MSASTRTDKTAPDATLDKTLRAKATEAYASQSRESLEDKWILDYLPLVRHIVQKVTAQFSLNNAGMEDLISAGTLGLVKAARGFDPTKNARFKTYAYLRIRGAVIDELRGRSFLPSTGHAQIRRIRKIYRQYTETNGHPPGDEKLAAEVGISLQRLYRVLEGARKQHFLSIHGLSEEQPALGPLVPADDSPTPDVQAERKESLGRLAQGIQELPKRDRLILLLYYDRDLTMKEVAAVLDITESRVSQLHASSLFRLSAKLGAE